LRLKFKSKMMKHRTSGRGKEAEGHNNRYSNQESIYESTPALNKGWKHPLLNKENNQNSQNFLGRPKEEPRFGQFDAVKSMDVPKRLRTSVNDQEFGQFKKQKAKNYQEDFRNSQEVFRFRQKQSTEPRE
jgi:hypothetical protein